MNTIMTNILLCVLYNTICSKVKNTFYISIYCKLLLQSKFGTKALRSQQTSSLMLFHVTSYIIRQYYSDYYHFEQEPTW